MLGVHRLCVCLIAVALLQPSSSIGQSIISGIVVDRDTKTLWLGFPVPVTKGSSFDIKLMPGGATIAHALVVDATVDSPYIAKATFKSMEKAPLIPIGAYAEQSFAEVCEPGELLGSKSPKPPKERVNPLSLQVGAFFPTDSLIRDETDSVWPFFELDYACGNSGSGNTYIGLGYFGGKGTNVEDISGLGLVPVRRNINIYPLTFNGRFNLSGNGGTANYVRLGIGAYYMRTNTRFDNTVDTLDAVHFGWQAGFGHESRRGQSVQISYVDVADSDINGLVFTVGTRF